jgi:hypothetical protein
MFMPSTFARLDHSQEQHRHQFRPTRSRYQLTPASQFIPPDFRPTLADHELAELFFGRLKVTSGGPVALVP